MLYSTLLNFCLKVHDDLCESNHFPIILENIQSSDNEKLHYTNVKRLLSICTNNWRITSNIFLNISDTVLKTNETNIHCLYIANYTSGAGTVQHSGAKECKPGFWWSSSGSIYLSVI